MVGYCMAARTGWPVTALTKLELEPLNIFKTTFGRHLWSTTPEWESTKMVAQPHSDYVGLIGSIPRGDDLGSGP